MDSGLANLRSAGLAGADLAILALVAMLLDWRRALVAVVAIGLLPDAATVLSLAG